MGLSNIEDAYPRFNTFSASRYTFFRFGIADPTKLYLKGSGK